MKATEHDSVGLSRFALRHPRAATVVLVGIVLLGVMAYVSTPRFESPAVIAPGFTVTTVLPGAEPEKVEELITKHLEDAFNELDDVEFVEGYSGRSVSYLGCKCFDDTDMRDVLEKVHKKVAEASRLFPPEARRPRVTEFNTFDVPVLIYALAGPYGTRELRDFSERMKARIGLVEQVSEVLVEGVEDDEVSVLADPTALRQLGIPVMQVAAALGGRNMAVPGGALKVGTGNYLVVADNVFRTPRDVAATVVGFNGLTPVTVEDVARVRVGPQALDYRVRFDGSRAAVVSVRMKRGADIFQVTSAVEDIVAGLRREFPPELVVEPVSVQRDGVATVVDTFESNLFMGSLLVGAIILWHLGARSSVVVLSAIPLSLFFALMLMSFVGIEYHKISIFSLVLVLGMMVDNGIVMAENIFRRLEEEDGRSAADIILEAADQVSVPLVSSTLTTVAAFIPLWLMGGMTGRFIQALPQTVVLALGSSLATAIFFTPLLAHWVVAFAGRGRESAAFDGAVADRWAWVHDWYREKLHAMLDRKFIVLGASVALFALSVKLIPLLGLEFFPATDRGQFLVELLLPAKYDLAASDEAARRVEAILADTRGVKNFLVYVGRGVPRFHYNIYRRELASYASMLVSVERGTTTGEIIAGLRKAIERMPGVRVTFQEVKEGPSSGMPVALRVMGDDYDQVIAVAGRLEEQLRSIPGTVDVERDDFEQVPSLRVRLDEVKARLLGVDGAEVARTVRAAIEGLTVTTYRAPDGRELDVSLRLFEPGTMTVERMRELELPARAGASVPLQHVAEIELDSHVSIRYRRHSRPAIRVRSRVERVLPSTVIETLRQMPKDFVPRNYVIEYGGDNEGRDKSFRTLGKAMVAALLLIFLILVAQFGSFLQPLVVLFCLPLSIVGAVVGLFMTGYPFGFMAFLGFVALSGIVVNDAILLFDFINALRAGGMDGRDAVVEAGIVRHRAIYLTTITTIVGLLPLAVTGGPLWAPLAWVIVFGIAASTILTLLVIPVGYAFVERL